MATQKPSLRHEKEKTELLQRLSRGTGKWDSSHPRHRLLDALYGFRKYFDRNMDEVKRWKKLYKGVSRQQKKVGVATHALCPPPDTGPDGDV